MITTDEQVRQWADEAQRYFGFLERSGYIRQTPQLSVMWGRVTYLGSTLGVRLEVEVDSFFMFVALFRVGHPEHNASKYLKSTLALLGLPTGKLEELMSLRGDFANCSRMLEILAAVLEENLERIDSAAEDLFPK